MSHSKKKRRGEEEEEVKIDDAEEEEAEEGEEEEELHSILRMGTHDIRGETFNINLQATESKPLLGQEHNNPSAALDRYLLGNNKSEEDDEKS